MSQAISIHKTAASAAPLTEGHLLHQPELCIRRRFYCMGFPIDLSTNNPEVEAAAEENWPENEQRFEIDPLRIEIIVLQTAVSPCPPAPVFRPLGHLTVQIADAYNFFVMDLEAGTTKVCVSLSAVANQSYLRYFFLEPAAIGHIAMRHTVPIHAAAVSFRDRGVLLCGESGAGKSSLAYACARAGWSYTTDDASFMLLDEQKPVVIGNCHQLRFRPSAREIFPELAKYEITPRAAGKPSIELPTSNFPMIHQKPAAHIDLLIFLNRLRSGPPSLLPSTTGRARTFILQQHFGPSWIHTLREQATDRLLRNVAVFELSYKNFDDAIDHLEQYLGRP